MKLRNFLEKHKFVISVCLITLCVLMVGIGLLYSKIAQGLLVWWMAAILIGAVALIPLIALVIRKRWLSLQTLTFLLLVVLAPIYMFVFTPNSVPDEIVHYNTAYHISNVILFEFDDEDYHLHMRREDSVYVAKTSTKISPDHYNDVSKDNHLLCKDKEIIISKNGYLTQKVLAYIPSGIGVALGRLLGLSAYWTYQLGRLFNFIFFALFVFFAIKLMPFGKIALSAIALIPMNMHIMASYSYDVFTTGGVILLFALIMNLMHGEKKIGFKELGILALLIAVIIPQKVVYIGVAALVLLLPKEKFQHQKWHFLFKCILGLFAVGGILVLQFHNTSKLVSDSVTYSESIAGYSINYIFTHIPEILAMLFRTICYKTEFYLKSLVAYFGWFQIEAPWYLAIPVYFILFLSFMKKDDEPESLPFMERLYTVILFMVVFLLTQLLLLIDHTPLGSPTIEGVQGRYLIPALPLVFLVLRNSMVTVKKNIDDVILILMPALNIITLIYCVASVFM